MRTLQDTIPFQWYFVEPMPKDIYNDVYVWWQKAQLTFDWKYWVWKLVWTWIWWGTDCPFDWVITMPAWHVSGTTCDDFKNLFFASQPPTMQLRWTVAFGLYEVGQTLATPLIEWRWALWANPAGTLTNLSITDPAFSQANPTPWTRYGTNDGDVLVVLWSTKTYNWSLTDSEWRTANASGNYSGAYPYYGTSVDITTLTKQTLVANSSPYFQIDMVAETWGDKYKADFEAANVTISWVQFYNTVSSTREWMGGSQANSLTLWTTSAVTQTVQGNVINYTRYTHNWSDGWALQTRFYN